MENKRNCVYCGKIIAVNSKEHIIQNAIGGLNVSENICCAECNACLSKSIDAPFTKIFAPLTGKIKGLVKSHNTKSVASYMGVAKTGKEIYDVIIKDNKVVSAPDFSKNKKCDVSEADWIILSSYFNLDNVSYKNGLSKIAFNFALQQDISLDLLKQKMVVTTQNGNVTSIKFKFQVIPFIALNPLDEYIELNTPMLLYHNLILFNEENQLWCYIDLFNTFQSYVLLTDKWDKNKHIYKSYLQLLQKIDRNISDLTNIDLKDISKLAMKYGILPTTDIDMFRKKLTKIVQEQSLIRNMEEVITLKLGDDYFTEDMMNVAEPKESAFRLESLRLYFDEDDRLQKDCYRKVTLMPGSSFEVASYPWLINQFYVCNIIDFKKYTYAKFNRLMDFLNKQ